MAEKGQELIEQGIERMLKGETSVAIRLLTDAIKINPYERGLYK
jgi:hypothetical protein